MDKLRCVKQFRSSESQALGEAIFHLENELKSLRDAMDTFFREHKVLDHFEKSPNTDPTTSFDDADQGQSEHDNDLEKEEVSDGIVEETVEEEFVPEEKEFSGAGVASLLEEESVLCPKPDKPSPPVLIEEVFQENPEKSPSGSDVFVEEDVDDYQTIGDWKFWESECDDCLTMRREFHGGVGVRHMDSWLKSTCDRCKAERFMSFKNDQKYQKTESVNKKLKGKKDLKEYMESLVDEIDESTNLKKALKSSDGEKNFSINLFVK